MTVYVPDGHGALVAVTPKGASEPPKGPGKPVPVAVYSKLVAAGLSPQDAIRAGQALQE